ncbi:cytochrome c oxidase biogenesis protein Cmc1 like-domain-containing protein [Scheffersomyces xylosifermentans]|uniref:cytochrome c oxidase biogenesis protein Cmc1 like-domain-containing protein n=1 Tax=Scheffersomyces xylosifermentans TaxID=1304137 RepID=UPI00315DEBC9
MSSYGNKNKKTFNDVELPTNPNMPAWVITPKEEKAIFERWRKKAFAKCDDLIRAYVECSNSYQNPLEGMKKCEKINDQAQGCVAQFQKQKYLDIERDLLIDEKIAKKKAYKLYLQKLEEEKKEKK